MTAYVGRLEDVSLGYVQAGLNYLMALYSVEEPLTLMPLSKMLNWRLLPKWTDPLSYWTGQVGVSRRVGILHHTPDTLTSMPQMAEVNLGLTTLETNEVPKWIIEDLNESSIPALIVPSEFNKQEFLVSGYEKPIHVVPHTVGAWWWNDPIPKEIPNDRPFTFYYVGGWNNRKNPETALRAYLKAFPTPQENVAFALKLTGGKNLEAYISQIIKEETKQSSRDDIWVWAESWSEDQIRWLHHFGDVFVSTHRGEGFGLGPLMAKLVGNRCIATNWSAPIEYLSSIQGDALLPYEMVQVEGMDQQQHHFRVSKKQKLLWADPSVEACASAMLDMVKQGRLNRTFDGIDEFRLKYEWHNIGTELKNILDIYR
jgi:glycosyltransferase involved in cell wall biosynthesis